GDERRTEITHGEGEIDIEDLIADQQMVISITHSGYIKSLPLNTYRQQRRGGIGVTGMEMKDDDYIENLFVCSTHDYLLFFNIRDDDELIAVRRTSGHDDIIMASRSGQAARFSENQARSMGRDTSGVRGMNVSQKNNAVLAMDVARDDQELLVVTENGYGKRTPIPDYPVKGRGAMGVKTIQLTENKGQLAGALVVREHQELVFVSQNGMVQRTSVRGINRYGRASQGVRVMNIRDDDQVSAEALVVESEAPTAAPVAEDE